MPEGLVIDADGVPLDLWDNADYGVVDHAYPAPPPEFQWAGSVDTEGSEPASRKHQNRAITLTVETYSADALYALQAKAAKVFRKGGTLTRTLADGRTITFDLHATEQYEATFDQVFHMSAGDVSTVRMQFIAKPYGRGEEISGTVHTGTNGYCVFVETDIAGDVPALGRMIVQNSDSTYSALRLMYGVRSSNYSSSIAAGLFYQAETGQAVDAAPATGQAGATGSTNKVMAHANVGTDGISAFAIGVSGSPILAHTGEYRVFVRAWALSGNSGVVSTRLLWYPQSTTAANTYNANGWVPMQTLSGAAAKGNWYLVDLGTVAIPGNSVGDQVWTAYIQSKSTVSTDDVEYDSVIFMPIADGYAVLSGETILRTNGAAQVDHRSAYCRSSVSTSWYTPRVFEGDRLYIPPSGPEGQPTQVMVAVGGSASVGASADNLIPNPSLPVITAQLHWTPRYLVMPNPD